VAIAVRLQPTAAKLGLRADSRYPCARADDRRGETDWKRKAERTDEAYFRTGARATSRRARRRLFLTGSRACARASPRSKQIATPPASPGARLVAITPDAHFGYGVPAFGCVILTDRRSEAPIAMGRSGSDIWLAA